MDKPPVEFRIPITEAESLALEDCKDGDTYAKIITAIRAARDGAFPADWWENMIDSGKMYRILSRW